MLLFSLKGIKTSFKQAKLKFRNFMSVSITVQVSDGMIKRKVKSMEMNLQRDKNFKKKLTIGEINEEI